MMTSGPISECYQFDLFVSQLFRFGPVRVAWGDSRSHVEYCLFDNSIKIQRFITNSDEFTG